MNAPPSLEEQDLATLGWAPSARRAWWFLRAAGLGNDLSFAVLDEISRVEIRRAERELWAGIEARWDR